MHKISLLSLKTTFDVLVLFCHFHKIHTHTHRRAQEMVGGWPNPPSSISSSPRDSHILYLLG